MDKKLTLTDIEENPKYLQDFYQHELSKIGLRTEALTFVFVTRLGIGRQSPYAKVSAGSQPINCVTAEAYSCLPEAATCLIL